MPEQITIDLEPLKNAVIQAAVENDGYISSRDALAILANARVNEFALARSLGLNFDPSIGNFQGLSALFSHLTGITIKVRAATGVEA